MTGKVGVTVPSIPQVPQYFSNTKAGQVALAQWETAGLARAGVRADGRVIGAGQFRGG